MILVLSYFVYSELFFILKAANNNFQLLFKLLKKSSSEQLIHSFISVLQSLLLIALLKIYTIIFSLIQINCNQIGLSKITVMTVLLSYDACIRQYICTMQRLGESTFLSLCIRLLLQNKSIILFTLLVTTNYDSAD